MEIYISVDIETDGPIPGPNSMLSLGAAAYKQMLSNDDYVLVDKFTVNIEPLEGASPDPSTEEWWEKQSKEVYEAARSNPQKPEIAMAKFSNWIKDLTIKNRQITGSCKPVFVGYPAGFDFLFVYWYLIKFTGFSPFSFSAIDIKTYAMAILKTDYRDTTKRNMPNRWFDGLEKHTHKAIDDAIEQGQLFINMLKENYNG